MATVHVIGAGVAGLAAAVELTLAQHRVVIHEQAGHAGGRCRSFHDALLDCVIDNGNHLLLSGNLSAKRYLDAIGAADRLTGPERARFPFLDHATGERWTIDLNRGPMPWWILDKDRRVPGTKLTEYLGGLKLLSAGERTVAELFAGQGELYRRFWEPFTVAVLNTPPELAAARLLVPVIRETLARGADYSRPLIARRGLSDSFVAPALDWLAARGADIRLNDRVSGLDLEAGRVAGLAATRGRETVGAGDGVVLAVPAWAAVELVPGLTAPDRFVPIVNVHFRLPDGRRPAMDEPLLGLVGALSQWLFVRDDVASVTISAADEAAGRPAEAILAQVWREIAPPLGHDPAAVPPGRVIKERRATFLGTPEQVARRPAPTTAWRNLVLAGDWTDNGLPATIEGAIRSGQGAASRLNSGQIP